MRVPGAVLGILLLGPLSVAQGQAVQDWWQRSVTVRTKYYQLKTDLPEDQARELASHMDSTAETYNAMFSALPVRARRPSSLGMLLFASEADYVRTLQERFNVNAAGSWGMCISSGDNIILAGYRGQHSVEEVKPLLQHEGFHQFARHLFPDMPPWANEGLAEVFERGIRVGDRLALGDVRQLDIDRLRASRAANRLLPLQTFFAIDPHTWLHTVAAGAAGDNYRQAWSVVHFLMFAENGKYQQRFLKFLVELNRVDDWQQAFIRAYGLPNFKAMQEAWEKHVTALVRTDYQETTRRLEFLAAGLAQLGGEGVRPQTLEELKAELTQPSFTHTSQLFGEQRELLASDARNFEIPNAQFLGRPRFALVDNRGKELASASRSSLSQPNLATVRLYPHVFAARLKKSGRDEYEFALHLEAAEPPEDDPDAKSPPAAQAVSSEPPAPRVEPIRTWQSANGKYSMQGKLLKVADGYVHLQREDQVQVKILKEQLSEADQKYVGEWEQRQ